MNLDLFIRKAAKIIEPKIKEVLNEPDPAACGGLRLCRESPDNYRGSATKLLFCRDSMKSGVSGRRRDKSLDKKFKNLVNYQIETGGKRIRPALAVLSCLVCGGKPEDALYPAAGAEILHNYTLIIDDIIDRSGLRRGKLACWKKFGRSIAECIGMFFASSIFQAVNRKKDSKEILEIFAITLKKIVEGEILDILFEQGGREKEIFVLKNRYSKLDEKDYISMVSKKTATLIGTSCLVGGICAGADNSKLKDLKNYGFNLGIAFQLQDDILDIFGRKREFGKVIGQDIKERKLGNILILLASKEEKEICNLLRKKEIEVKKIINLIKETKALEKAEKLKEKYIEKARLNLKNLPQNEWKELLFEFLDYAADRGR